MPKLWEMCFPVILRYGLHCKFASELTASSHDNKHLHSSSGKMLVIYCDHRPAEFFLRVCEEIENGLVKAGIAHGKTVPATSSHPLPGSKGYVFYRNDRNPKTHEYLEGPGGFNPFKQDDPFVNGYSSPRNIAAKRSMDFLKKQEAAAYLPR